MKESHDYNEGSSHANSRRYNLCDVWGFPLVKS
jgi:hypothetical protein